MKSSQIGATVVRSLLQSSTPMERTYESGRHVVSIQAHGWARLIPAAFLTFWLCGWAAGEIFASGALALGLLRAVAPDAPLPFGISMPSFGAGGAIMIGFLALWLFFWTLGGYAAFSALVEMLFLRERLSFDAGGVRIEKRTLGTHAREWTADAIQGFFVRIPGGTLEIEAGGTRHRLLALGTPAEKKALRDELRGIFGRGAAVSPSRELPKGWESWLDPEGATVLMRDRSIRATQTRVLALLAFGMAAVVWLVARTRGPAGFLTRDFLVPVVLLGVPLAAGLAWLGFGGSQIRIRPGSVEFRRWLFSKVWSQTLRPTSIEISRRLDSDHDAWFSVDVREGNRTRRVHSSTNEFDTVRRLGYWLAAQTGVELRTSGGAELDA